MGFWRAHQKPWLKGFDALLERPLDVDGPADSILCGTQRQLNLHPAMHLECLTINLGADHPYPDPN